MNKTFATSARARRAASLVRMETLEERKLLSTFEVINNSDTGPGSFRQAIISNNATPGTNAIDFAIPGTGVQTISLSTPLPAVNNPAIIDATTQPGYAGSPLIELNGANIYLPGVTPPTLQPGVIGLVLSGGASTVKGLTIDRFTGAGIYATGDSNTIAADFIGTDPTGTRSSGNGADGIVIGSRNNTIGGPTAASMNVISGNTGRGIFLGTSGSLPGNNLVEGNMIGTDLTGTIDVGNGLAGVDVESSRNSIGGTTISLGNTIHSNGGAGVQVGSYYYQGGVNQNRIVNNSIFNNVGLGIDIGNDGVTPTYFGTYGPNNHQNYPNLTSAYSVMSGGTTVEGTLIGAANSSFTINYYQSPSGDPSGFGQGLTPLSPPQQVLTDSTGSVDITSTLSAVIPVGQVVTATATDSNGNTSEFSRALVVTPAARSHLDVFANTGSATVNVPQTYYYNVVNNGPSKATNINFTALLPQGAMYLYGTSSQGAAPVDTNGTVTTNIGSLLDGNSATIALTYTLTTTGFATTTASVTSDQVDPNPVGRSVTQNIQVFPAPPTDLALSGAASPIPVQVGNDLTYTFLVTNLNFGNGASGVVVSNPLPRNVTFVSATSSQGPAPTFANGVVTANLGSIPASANATVTVVVQPTGAGQLSSTATVKGNESDYNQLNNSVTVLANVTPAPAIDLAVAVTAAPQPTQVGHNYTYVVIVANNGNATATGVNLTNLLPDAVGIVSIQTSQGTVALNGSTLTAALGTLGPGTQAAVTIVLKPGAPGPFVDQASVTADQTDFNIANNYSSNTTNVAADYTGPVLLNQRLTVDHKTITSVVLTFNKALDPTLASDPANYAIVDLGSNSSLSASGPNVPFSLVYNPIMRSVTLVPNKGLAVGRFYKLILNGPGAPGITDTFGNALDGVRDGLTNSAYIALIGRGTVTRPIAIQIGADIPHPNVTQGAAVPSNSGHSKSQKKAATPKVSHVKVVVVKATHPAPKTKAHH